MIVSIFAKTKTIDQIVAPLTDIQKELETALAEKAIEVTNLSAALEAAQHDISRAHMLAKRLNGLLGS
jgi:flagellar hook-associated protein FlgK